MCYNTNIMAEKEDFLSKATKIAAKSKGDNPAEPMNADVVNPAQSEGFLPQEEGKIIPPNATPLEPVDTKLEPAPGPGEKTLSNSASPEEEITEMGASGFVKISKSLDPNMGMFQNANDEATLSRLYPTIKTMVMEELTDTISRLPESDTKNIFAERENLDKFIDGVVAERTKAEANISAIMGNAVFTNKELTMLRAINTRGVIRKSLGEFDSGLSNDQLAEIINIVTPLCLFHKPKSADQSNVTNTDASTT